MANIAIIGNAGGGKSTLARALASKRLLRLIEIDSWLWRPGWQLTPLDRYERQHAEIIAQQGWVIEGLGHQASIPARLARADEIILIDMPLWVHYWLAAERQLAWAQGRLDHPPAGALTMPPTRALFKTIWDVEQTWMPAIRDLCGQAEREGKTVVRLCSIEDLDAYAASIGLPPKCG